MLLSAVKNILRGRVFDEMFLMSIATLGAIVIHQLPEAVAVMLFYSVGEYVQNLAVGKSRPRSVSPGDTVLSGFVNDSGKLVIQVTKSFSESSVSRILELVENAATRKAPNSHRPLISPAPHPQQLQSGNLPVRATVRSPRPQHSRRETHRGMHR